MSEMLEIARRKERMSAIKAKENQGTRTDILQNSARSINSTQEASEVIGVSRDTYQRMKTIEDNRSLLDPSDFAEWDEGTKRSFLK